MVGVESFAGRLRLAIWYLRFVLASLGATSDVLGAMALLLESPSWVSGSWHFLGYLLSGTNVLIQPRMFWVVLFQANHRLPLLYLCHLMSGPFPPAAGKNKLTSELPLDYAHAANYSRLRKVGIRAWIFAGFPSCLGTLGFGVGGQSYSNCSTFWQLLSRLPTLKSGFGFSTSAGLQPNRLRLREL